MNKEMYDRMDGLVNVNDVIKLDHGARGIVKDLSKDGFDRKDIYEYIREVLFGRHTMETENNCIEFITDEDRAMQVNTEIRPDPVIIKDRY